MVAALALACSGSCLAYGVTGHLRVAFENWDLLLARELGRPIPDGGTAFAAGLGSIVSDIGYVYPDLIAFSERVHYLRAWEFRERMVAVAKQTRPNDARLLAFALGIRAHYWGDRVGHPSGTNELVAELRLREKADRPPSRRRWVYEDDERRHMRVEWRAVVFDLRHGSKAALDGFQRYLADVRESRESVAAMAELLRRVMTELFPGSQSYPDFEQLWSYALYAAETICTGLNVASLDASDEAARLKHRCQTDADYYRDRPKKAPRDVLEQNYKDLTTPLAPDAEVTERKIYELSHATVRRVLKDAVLRGTDPHVNLDSGLPRAGKTYDLADQAMRIALESAQRNGTPADVDGAKKLHDEFHAQGEHVRRYFAQPMSSRSRAELLLSSTETAGLTGIWLPSELTLGKRFNVDYLIKSACEGSGEPLRLPQHRTSVAEFAVAPNGRLCIRTDARLIDAVYALAIVNESLGKPAMKAIPVSVARWSPAYLEALRGLRLER